MKKTLVALVILVALGGYVYKFERGKAPEEGTSGTLAQVLGYSADSVTKLQIERQGDPLWLVRQKDGRGEAWKLEKPMNAAADAEEAKRIVTELSEAMVDRVLTPNVADLKPFGLDKPTWELTIVTDGGRAHTLLVGGKDVGGANLYLKPKDAAKVLVMSAYSVESLQTKKADDLRDKTVIAYNKDDVRQIELASGGQTVRIERSGAEEWQITAPVKAKAKKEKVSSILMSFEKLRGSKIVEDNPKDLKQYGLDQPQAKVSVWVKGEKEPRVALLGGKDPAGGDLYAKGDRNPSVVTVYSYILNDAQSKLEDIKEPEPVKEEKKPANAPFNAPAPPIGNVPAANGPGAPSANPPAVPAPKPAVPAAKPAAPAKPAPAAKPAPVAKPAPAANGPSIDKPIPQPAPPAKKP